MIGLTAMPAAANTDIPQCEGDFDPNGECMTGSHNAGMYLDRTSCDRNGQYHVMYSTRDTAHGTIGWYTYQCHHRQTIDGPLWSLELKGFVYK